MVDALCSYLSDTEITSDSSLRTSSIRRLKKEIGNGSQFLIVLHEHLGLEFISVHYKITYVSKYGKVV